jgi:hypothetical protein
MNEDSEMQMSGTDHPQAELDKSVGFLLAGQPHRRNLVAMGAHHVFCDLPLIAGQKSELCIFLFAGKFSCPVSNVRG